MKSRMRETRTSGSVRGSRQAFHKQIILKGVSRLSTRPLLMMYPFLQIDGDTEIVHSDMLPNGEVKVYIEKPDAKDGFHHATCFLPEYRWENINGFTDEEMKRYQEVIESTAHLIIEFSQQGGFDHAASF